MMSATNPAGKDLITPPKVKEKEYGTHEAADGNLLIGTYFCNLIRVSLGGSYG
jgi:hypothetical protein